MASTYVASYIAISIVIVKSTCLELVQMHEDLLYIKYIIYIVASDSSYMYIAEPACNDCFLIMPLFAFSCYIVSKKSTSTITTRSGTQKQGIAINDDGT